MARCKEKEDRISEVHIDLKHLILQHLPITEMARASVLSSQWRHVFLSHPNLIFDRNCYNEKLKRDKHNTPKHILADEFLKEIKRILSDHNGTIDKFTLFIPMARLLSLKEIYVLVCEVTGLLPTSITQLCIDNDSIHLFPVSAINISRFQKLTYLDIYRGSFYTLDLEALGINCGLFASEEFKFLEVKPETISHDLIQNISHILPTLRRLSLRTCGGPNELATTIHVSNVTDFVIKNCDVEACLFSEPCALSSLTVSLRSRVWNPSIGFLHVLPKLRRLELLDLSTIEGLSTCLNLKTYADEAPWALQKLILHTVIYPISYEHLQLRRIPMIQHLIVLLKRAKNVEELCITGYIGYFMDRMGDFQKYIDKDLTLDRLGSITYILSGKVEVYDVVLLRYLLRCSPALMNLNIGHAKHLDLRSRRQVEKQMSKLDRASRNVTVRYFYK